MPQEAVYLVMVTAQDNHNKFYNMIPQKDGNTFIVEYGRVGARGMKKPYPMSKWDSLYRQKINKGYTDTTSLHRTVKKTIVDSPYKDIEDAAVKKLVVQLLSYTNKFIKKTYTVSSKEVTQEMVDMAESLITGLGTCTDVTSFNCKLTKLFNAIPRPMGNVETFLANDVSEFKNIIEREQATLDVMAGQVKAHKKASVTMKGNAAGTDQTILDAMGLEIRPCTKEEEDQIVKHMDPESKPKFKRAYRVGNRETEEAYEKFKKTHCINKRGEKFLYHGSKNENFWSILTTGLSLSPNAAITGKMFGYGIYFATKAAKSIGYSSLRGSFWSQRNHAKMADQGFLAIYKVAVGKPFNVHSFDPKYTTFRLKNIKAFGFDSLFAHKGSMLQNDEIIVYREEQCTIRYLVELG